MVVNPSLKIRIIIVCGFVICLSILTWLLTGILYHSEPALLQACGIAYSLGLRHGLDADHVSAIDNVTRKLVSEGKLPAGVGLFFSLGHSSVIFVGCLILFYTREAWESSNPHSLKIMNIVSSSISSIFLILIGTANAIQVHNVHKKLRQVRRERIYDYRAEAEGEGFGTKGLVSYCASGLFKMVSSSKMMLLVGFIFGLGFDTTASVTAIMATASSGHESGHDSKEYLFSECIILPLLFTCGMSFMDTADSLMMLGSYKWSDKKIVRKLFFNFVILLVSVIAALTIGAVIGFRLLVDLTECDDQGWKFCKAIAYIDTQFEIIGIFLTVTFIGIWVGGYFYYENSHWKRLEDEILIIPLDNTLLQLDDQLGEEEGREGVDICHLNKSSVSTTDPITNLSTPSTIAEYNTSFKQTV